MNKQEALETIQKNAEQKQRELMQLGREMPSLIENDAFKKLWESLREDLQGYLRQTLGVPKEKESKLLGFIGELYRVIEKPYRLIKLVQKKGNE